MLRGILCAHEEGVMLQLRNDMQFYVLHLQLLGSEGLWALYVLLGGRRAARRRRLLLHTIPQPGCTFSRSLHHSPTGRNSDNGSL